MQTWLNVNVARGITSSTFFHAAMFPWKWLTKIVPSDKIKQNVFAKLGNLTDILLKFDFLKVFQMIRYVPQTCYFHLKWSYYRLVEFLQETNNENDHK